MKGLLKSLMLCAMLFTAASCVYDFATWETLFLTCEAS